MPSKNIDKKAICPFYMADLKRGIRCEGLTDDETNIRDFVTAERESHSEQDRQFMTVSIRADQDVRMGIITDVKQELRRCSALKIMYSARKGGQ